MGAGALTVLCCIVLHIQVDLISQVVEAHAHAEAKRGYFHALNTETLEIIMINTVIFDMDGVLIDSEPIHQRVNLGYFKNLGASVSQDFYDQNFIGLPVEQMLIYLKKEYNLEKSLTNMMKESSSLLFEDFAQSELAPMEGVEALLKGIKERGYNLAVGSSSSKELIALIIRKLGMRDYFHYLVSGYQVERGKPHPDLFLKIAEMFQVSPENCVVIEDSSLGLEAAYRAGMNAVGVESPASRQDMSRASITVSCFNSSERKKILSALKNW
jgi:HAD superfamily hydrolase (TIGR01509 family)